MSPKKFKTRIDGSPSQIGQAYPVGRPGETHRLPARAGMEPSDRVAGVKERSLGSGSNLEQLKALDHEFLDHKISQEEYNRRRAVLGGKMPEPLGAGKPCHIVDGLCLEHGYSVSPNVACPVGGQKESYKQAEHPWKPDANSNDGYWYITNGLTKKRIGPVGGKVNYYDRACKEADKRNGTYNQPSQEEILSRMEQRAVEQGRPADEAQRYNGWSNHDTWNTKLLLDNTQETEKWEHAWGKNWLRKIKAGTFDPEKAELVVSKYLVPTARGKNKRFAGPDFTPDPDIDPKKVNKAEIVHSIISEEAEEETYREKQIKPISAETINVSKEKYHITLSRRIAEDQAHGKQIYRLPNGAYAVEK